MKHTETVRIVPGVKNAVLLMHGICGTPNHFRMRIPLEQLVPADWSLHNILLPGHGGTVEDFGFSSMKAWRGAARAAFEKLAAAHEHVFLVGHSMGTLFALELAVDFPEKVSALFLLGVPMRPHLAPAAISSCMRLALGRLRPGCPEMAILDACGVTPTWMLWRYLTWVPRFVELFVQVGRTERVLDRLKVPAVAFQSRKDELVNRRSAGVLRKYSIIDVRILEDSSHFFYSPEDTQILRSAFTELISHG